MPCFNEEEVLPETTKRLTAKFEFLIKSERINSNSRIVYVNDGSKDKTWSIMEKIVENCVYFQGIKLSRNKGHQNALLAGLMYAKDKADIIISMDADLQDDIDAIDKFIEKSELGFDVIYGVRSARKTDSYFKRTSAELFYKLMKLLGADIIYNHADYRLMSKRALEGLSEFDEANLFLRGIVPLIGYSSTIVEYERNERFLGESKYPLKKMLNFAFDGITSFSVKPIRMITTIGFLVFSVSILFLIYFFYTYFVGRTVQGWATTVISIWALGGLQLLAIGIIGEYIAKTYIETKHRPKYIIETIIGE
ncbi:MAG: glycosyltransferase family 2 protein [Ignavibacteria bacterium]|nr:glycosyltransferase family 2 protein [Ignavibacteria bacterium]